MAIDYENIKIKLEEKLSDFNINKIEIKKPSEVLHGYQDGGLKIDYWKEHEILSIVKWSESEYNGDWEIYSFNKLFLDVERYSNEDDMINAIVFHFKKWRGGK